MEQIISGHGVWLVAAFIALESIGIPLPAEAVLIAAAFFAARHGLNVWPLIAAGIIAAIWARLSVSGSARNTAVSY